jgi:fructose transport system substrate-binding protein
MIPQRRRAQALGAGVLVLALALSACSGSANSSSSGAKDQIGVSLIIKTASSPYFRAIQSGAESEAKKSGVKLTVAAGKDFNDMDSQVQAIENAISLGQKGILITPNGQPVIDALARARDAGIKVIELDDVPDPVSAVDGVFATDNREAGKAIGAWAAATLHGAVANIALLPAFKDQVIPLDAQREKGFLEGLGVKVAKPDAIGGEATSGNYSGGDYNIVCEEASNASEDGGRTAIEKCLERNKNINVVYAINENAAAGAYEGMKSLGKESGVLFVGIDGGCAGVKQIATGTLSATAQQYPTKMGELGVQAIRDLVDDGKKPAPSAGLDFFNTGVKLVTDHAVPGVESITSQDASKVCWG